jgi:hypothetical protein
VHHPVEAPVCSVLARRYTITNQAMMSSSKESTRAHSAYFR